jgi:serine/arginine repetitive matrix protein 2
MMSPTPRGKTRGVSVDRAGTALANSARRNTRLSDVAEIVERQGSTGSINYSRPMSPTQAPKATKATKANGSWFTAPTGTLSDKPLARPATADGYRSQDARNVQSNIAAAANRPTKKKQIAQSTQGNHLARANNTSVPSFDEPPAETVMVYDPASRTFVAKARSTATQHATQQEPPSPTKPTPASPKAGEYDPSTRKIVPAIPPQQPSIVVNAGDTPARRAKPVVAAVDTKTQPPLRSPARSDTSNSPVSPRAAGILSKQPSIVREDPEGEQEAETTTATKPNARKTNGFTGFSKTTMRPALATPASPIRTRNRSESLDVPNSASGNTGRARGNSYSPSRSARFSESPIVEFTRHDPPERGVSPAKSAMKHSPGSSLRGTSPMNLGASPASKAMSDTSDTPSVDDSGKKKKKSVRVSFTDQASTIEPPVTPSFRAAAARKVSPLIDDDMEEIMKPRPDLPSFGSVRPSRVQQEVAEKVTERPPDRREASSDRAIGGVISHDAAKFKSASDPAPPEVTSKNGTLYSSDESEDEVATATELDAGDATAKAVSSQVVGPVPPPLDLEKKEDRHSGIKISLQPPTPGEEVTTFEDAAKAESPPPRSSLEKFVVPGGWSPDADDNVPKPAPATTENSSSKLKSVPDNAAATPASQPDVVAGDAPPEVQLSDIAESDSDNSAVYSDAEEDLSYMDESGFASMDAIVESPVVKNKKEAGPESPSLRQAARRTSKEEPRAPPDDWSHATSYWKQLSKQQREQIERSHLSSDDEFAPTANSLANRPKKKKSALKQSAPAEPATTPMPTQPTRSAMRKSMRGPPEPAPPTTNTVHMRSSLREGGGGMRTSMRDRPQSEYTAAKPAERQNHRATASGSNLPLAAAGGAMSRRPQSPDEISQDGPFPKMEQRQQQAQTNARLAKKMPPPPAPANDSDSESSFKKKRRPSQSNMDTSGRYAMKRSMRAGSIDDSQLQQRPISPLPPTSRKAFSVRSLSPTGSFFGRKQLKESMRAPPADSGARTLRGPNSMGAKTAKAQRKPPPAPRQTASTSNMASKFKSKFADSDDSDDDDRSRGQKPSFFRSRFADSDDDEPSSRAVIPADLTPVRGIPRRRDQQDGDSTDLSDEDDDDLRKASRGRNKQSQPIVPDPSDIDKAMEAARRNLGMTNGSAAPGILPVNEGSALSKGSLRKGPERPLSPANEDSPKRRGFMGSILRRSRTYSNTSQKPPMASPPPPLPTNFAPTNPRPGKLQRRTSTATQDRDYFNNNNPKTLPEEGDANWPLTPPGRLGELRPSTSDGVSRHEQAVLLARQMRPDIGRSQSNSDGAIINGGSHVGFADESNGMNGKSGAYGPKTPKKKKFGLLRRAFRLDD